MERKGIRLTREELEHMIENMEATGKDATGLKKALEEQYPPTLPSRKRPPLPEAPPPRTFGIQPIMEGDTIVGFNIYDWTGTIIKDRKAITDAIQSEYPEVKPEEIDYASIGYGDYEAHVRLKR